MNKTLIKGLVAALLAFIAGYVGETQSINYTYLGFYVVAYTIWYLGKNYVFPSTSPLGSINIWDLLSGLILAVGAGLIALAGQWITVTIIDWHQIWVTVYTSSLAYLAVKFGFNSKGVIGVVDPPIPPKG